MQSDINLIWVGGATGGALAITSSAVASTGALDLAQGLMLTGSTYPASPMTNGNASVFGEDLGVGNQRLQFLCDIGAAFAGGASLNIALQGAVDAAGGAYPANLSGLTWTTYAETGAIPLASINEANTRLPLFDWPHRAIAAALPRFLRFLYTPVGAFSAGTISFTGLVLQPTEYATLAQYPSGFSVSA